MRNITIELLHIAIYYNWHNYIYTIGINLMGRKKSSYLNLGSYNIVYLTYCEKKRCVYTKKKEKKR